MSNAPSGSRPGYFQHVTQAVDALHQELVDISLDIHAHPELNYQEYHAAQVLADALERHGFQVERGVGGVETAFRAIMPGGQWGWPDCGLTGGVRCPAGDRPRLRP